MSANPSPKNRLFTDGRAAVYAEKQEKSQPFDIHNYKRRLRLAYRKIERNNALSSQDKELLTKFGKYLEAMDLNQGRTAKALHQLYILRRHFPTAIDSFPAADRGALEELVTWINRDSGYKPWTRSDAKGWVKRFYKWVRCGTTDKDVPFPPEVSWIKTNIKKNELTQPQILTSDEAKLMISAALKTRDKAFIAVAHEGGFRIGEMLKICIEDVEFDQYGATVSVSGKTGGRVVRLITSAPILTRYIEEHPYKDDSTSPLWVSFTKNYGKRPLCYFRVTRMLKETAKRAKINKRVHTHIFRHSAATRDAGFLTDRELVLKYGWDSSSKMPARYAHLNGRDVEQKLIAVYSGQKIQQKVPDFTPIICFRCNERNSPGLRFCGRCGTPLDPEGLAKMSIGDMQSSLRLEAVEKKLEEALGQKKPDDE